MDLGSARVGAGITTVGAAGAAATKVGRTPPLETGVGDAGTAPAVTGAALPLPAGAAEATGDAATDAAALAAGLVGGLTLGLAGALAGVLATALAAGAFVDFATLAGGAGFFTTGFFVAAAFTAGFFAAGGDFLATDLATVLPVLAGAFVTLAFGAGFLALGGALLAVLVDLPFADALADALAPALAVAFAFFAVANVISSFLLQVKTVSHFVAEQVAFALDRQAGLGGIFDPADRASQHRVTAV